MSPVSAESSCPEAGARVAVERHGHVLVIRMRRPAKRNAIDPGMTTSLDTALNELDDDPDLRCGILTGGEQVFSAGTDLAVGAGDPTPRGGPYGVVRRQRTTPLIAAVEGVAFGGGFELVLACDMVVAGRSARFALPEVSRGVVATCGALFRAWRPLPLNVAKQMLLTGLPLSASRAHQLGLVNELVDDGQAEAAALTLAEQVCANSPLSVTATLTAVDRVAGETDEFGWEVTRHAIDTVLGSEDQREGVSAFLEKRRPRWRGR
ncbi:enoyl-CoA hydratase/isomerase family protein [Streptomyces ferrugineus]|uniref:Enoyl-CoA hydratase/isomerase family protein n=1 Tax=Streptomyces ferrugineus TaxID=1413221 RepID=A0A7M2SA83_9ACTN|nr:enoyl-CoA hydratase-related protein [Streptomyces ferrugineus]QOV33206.1 enoyl-CoA hydratase/isomerase family protein [Streptomyces ferrugineus]